MRKKYLLIIVLCIFVGIAWHYLHSSRNDSSGEQTKSSGASGNDSSNGSHNAGTGSSGKGAAVPVAVATAKLGSVSVYLDGLGNITPRSTVTIHSLIDGELMEVMFKEGQMVKKDDLLARIDDRPYQAALKQAEGLLARDQALLEEAKIDLKRYQLLWQQNSIAKQQLDAQASLVKQYEGAVINDQGQIDTAKVNIIYTKITSPVTGRVGLRQVDPGNIVHTTDANGIVVVTELQPITAIFTIPEDDVPMALQHVNAGEELITEAWDRANKNRIAAGVLTAIDNEVDPTTGTVKFRAEFGNEDNSLFPSQFVNIRLRLATLRGVVTIPSSAVQRGTHGTFVYLVKPDKTVTVQNIVLGPVDGETVSVQSGVNAGDQMVVDGADALRDGAKIAIAASDTGVTPAPTAPQSTTEGKNVDKQHRNHGNNPDSQGKAP